MIRGKRATGSVTSAGRRHGSRFMGSSLRNMKPETPEGSYEELLVAKVVAGEPRSETELVERYSRGVLYLLRRWTRDEAVAEDLHQETFRLAIEKIRNGELRVAAKLQAFLRGLARTLSTRYYQREARWSGPPAEENQALDPTQDQLETLVHGEKSRLIRKLLGELQQDRDRQLLFRFYLAEERKERICADLGLSDLHFNRVLFRARQRFRQLCEAHQIQS